MTLRRGDRRVLWRRGRLAAAVGAVGLGWICASPARGYDLHFDYTSFETGFGQAHFDVLNYPSINGNYMMTSTDTHRPEMTANGNALAEFYNNWLADYNKTPKPTAIEEADAINTYTVNNSARNGAKPTWLVLNELSSSLWSANPGPSSISTYRTWAMQSVQRLRDVYGYNVVALAPFQNPGFNDESWVELSSIAYVGAEIYLSGTEVWNSGADNTARFNWAKGQYQSAKNSYLARGVPANKLFIIEHFANNAATYVDSGGVTRTTGWGRAGLASAADWDTVIQLRQDAILSVGFEGFLAYNWGGNAMGVTQAEQLQHEYYYRTRRVLPGQKPQWLSDSAIDVNGTTIPLSWSQPLNWLGGAPNASGAQANFWRTIKANRTITLDGSYTVGSMLFDAAFNYTISAGTGGSLTINNGASAATLTSNQGSHTIGVNISLASALGANISAGTFTVSGIVSGAGALTKSGAGTLLLSGANTYSGGTTVSAGTLQIGTGGAVGSVVGNITNNAQLTFNRSNASTAGVIDGAGTLTKQGAGTLTVPRFRQGTATISAGTLQMAQSASGGETSRVSSGYSIAAGAKLDVANNKFIVANGALGTRSGTTYNGVSGSIQSGYNNGLWNGSGIVTSMPDALNFLTAVGVGKASELGYGGTTWAGVSVGNNDVLVMYTYAGDANLNGRIDADDYALIDYYSTNPNKITGGDYGFTRGDFNYDGSIDADDYALIDSAVKRQGVAFQTRPLSAAASSLVAVPEPAMGFALVGLMLVSRRCRRPTS
jgi:autotransporter-associated beta strand protein